MKKIYLIIIVVLFAMQLKAQFRYDKFRYDKYGNIISSSVIPFSEIDEYKEKIEAYKIPSFVIPYIDNDALCKRYNNGKSIDELGETFTCGIDIRAEPVSLKVEPISIKKNGVCIKLKHGKLWRYAIEGTSARGIGVDLGFPKLLKGTYIAIFATDTTVKVISQTIIFHSENLLDRHKKRGLISSVFGNRMIIEYYEPDTLKVKEDIIIKRISYDFVGFGDQKSSFYDKQQLKSGRWGASAYSQCQKDVVCSDIGNYRNEAKSVVFIKVKFETDDDDDGYFEPHSKKATGFFLNKAGGYNGNEFPLLVTAGHVYYYEKLGITPIDIINDITEFGVFTKYQNLQCGTDDVTKGGIQLSCSFNRIALGSSYNKIYLPTYSPNKDYALLQANLNINDLSKYDLVYGAWSNNHDFNNHSNVGYFCIHHPKGDVKKINIDNDYATLASSGGFHLKYDLGLTESGSSGAPIFNSSRQIVGFHVSSVSNKDCSLIGQMTSTGGTFSYLYNEFSSILDINGVDTAQSSNPTPPAPSELPSHCRNCIQDDDETGIDCGGSCYPCGMQDVVTLKTAMDIPGKVKSRYDIFAAPDPNTLLALKGGSYSLEAGLNVYLKSGFQVEKGAAFYAGIDAELMTEADRGCQNPCVTAEGVFSPNGDGNDDYLDINQAFVTKFDIKVYSGRTGSNLVYQATNQPVFNNGTISIWDGSGAIYSYNRVVLTYYDCYGNSYVLPYSVTALGLKSASIENTITEAKMVDKNEIIEVYPNPATDNISINYSGNIFPLKYKLTDLNGKVIISRTITRSSELIDLRSVAAGTYIINAKAGDYNLIKKIVKR